MPAFFMENGSEGAQTDESSTSETTSSSQQSDSASASQENMSELDPTVGRKSRDFGSRYYKGVLIAKRDGFSLATNSIGPLWILEINDPASENNGEIFRCFEYLGADIMIGNPGDGATDLWFQIQTLQRPDGTPLDVAYNVGTHPPEG